MGRVAAKKSVTTSARTGFTISLPLQLKERIRSMAAERNRSLSNMINVLVQDGIAAEIRAAEIRRLRAVESAARAVYALDESCDGPEAESLGAALAELDAATAHSGQR